MIYSQPQFQPISPQMNISNFECFGAGNVRFFVPFVILRCSVSDLQPPSEEVIPSVNAKNASMNAKEEGTIIVATKAVNGEDVSILKRKNGCQKEEKISVLAKKKRLHKTTKKVTKEIVNLIYSSAEEEGSTWK